MKQDEILKTKRRNEGYQLFLTMNIHLTIVSIYSNEIKSGVSKSVTIIIYKNH